MNEMEKDNERLLQFLDRYGGDLKRWPAEARESARAMTSSDAAFARRLREAQALDGVLMRVEDEAAAEVSRDAVARLTDRVLADVANAQKVERLQPNATPPAPDLRAPRRFPDWFKAPVSVANALPASAAGGLLAASLMLGIFAGSSGWLDSAAGPVASAFGFTDGDAVALVGADDDFVGLVEEFL